MASKFGRLNPSKTVLLLCDMQEKFAKHISHFNEIVETSGRLVETSKHLQIPCLITEHYPKGFLIIFLFFSFYKSFENLRNF